MSDGRGASSARRHIQAAAAVHPAGPGLACRESDQAPIDAARARIWASCRGLDSLDNHARRFQQQMQLDAEQLPALRATLDELCGQRWLVSEHDLCTEDRSAAPATISSAALFTCERPESAQRAWQTLIEPLRAQGVRAIVADDSEQQTWQPSGATHWFIDRAARRRWIASIPDSDLRDIATLSLLGEKSAGMTVGASVNAVRLASHGEPLIMIDDDVHGPALCEPETKSALNFAQSRSPQKLDVHPNRSSAVAGLRASPDSLAQLHESLLGRGGSTLAAERGWEDDEQITPEIAAALAAGGRVVATSLGLCGDSGMSSAIHYLLRDTRHEGAHHGDYSACRLSREVRRLAGAPTLSRHTFFMTPCVALDQRQFLPPMIPSGRNADGIFGVTLQKCRPLDFIGFVPAAIPHDPPQPRALSEQQLFDDALRFPDLLLLQLALGHYSPRATATEPESRLADTGGFLQAMSRSSPNLLRDWAIDLAARQIASRIERLAANLERDPGDVRSADIRRAIRRLREADVEEEHVFPAGTDDMTGLRRRLECTGRVYCGWTSLLEYAERAGGPGHLVEA